MELEQFFMPIRRLHGDGGDGNPNHFTYTEVQLVVPVEEFLNSNWGGEDFFALASGDAMEKILWLTDDTLAAVVHDAPGDFDGYPHYDNLLLASSTAASGQVQTLTLTRLQETDADVSAGACSVFWRAIETSKSARIEIRGNGRALVQLPSGPTLSKFLRENLFLQVLDFHGFNFKEEHCRVLATLERKDLEVKLRHCKFEPKDAQDIFIEWFRHNQVVTELTSCEMDSSILFALIGGNNSVKKLAIDCHEEQTCSLLRVFPGNMGTRIEHLTVGGCFSEATWCLIFRSLATHPRITVLSVPDPPGVPYSFQPLSAASKITRMNAIVQMLHLNTVVQTIDLFHSFDAEEVYRNSILPRLEMNRNWFEVQRQAVKRADPSIRPQLLGRALHVVRYNPELVFLFLSENVPAFVRTEEKEEEDGDREQEFVTPLEQDPIIASVAGQKRKASS
jgi:hypothetical protein